jgi:hypothetical protein
MATFTNTGSKTVKVMYKVAGVQYYIGTEADPAGRPFDEVVVAPGATVELGDVTWQKTVELADVQVAVVRVGPQRGAAQDIVNRVVDENGDTNNIMVRYKVKGRQYNVAAGEGDVIDEPARTSYPWEEAIVAPGRAFYVTDDIAWTQVINMPKYKGPDLDKLFPMYSGG